MLCCKERKNSKANRKVSKYFDKKGEIKKELQECFLWLDYFSSRMDFFEKLFYHKLSKEFIKRKKSHHTCKELENKSYVRSLYNKVILENRFYLAKQVKKDGAYIYEKYDMYKFIITLIFACKSGNIKEFIDVPDVFYIVRQLKQTGVEIYLV